MQADIGQAGVHVKVNGKEYQSGLLQGETQKFQDGKILMSQTSQVSLDIQNPTVDKTKRNATGPYLTYGAIVSRETDNQRFIILAGKKWDDKNGRSFEAGGA